MEYYDKSEYLAHYGILGMRWGVRRFQNTDGSLTSAGRNRYGIGEARRAVSEWVSTKKKERTRAKALKKAAKVRKEKAKEKEKADREQQKIDKLRRETDALNAKTALIRAKIAEKEARRARRQQLLPKFLRGDNSSQQAQQTQKSENFALKAAKDGLSSVISTSIKNALTYDPAKNKPSEEELVRQAVAEGTREGLKNKAREEASRGSKEERLNNAIFEGRVAGEKQRAQETAASNYSYQEIADRNSRAGFGAGIKAGTMAAAKAAAESAATERFTRQRDSAVNSYASVVPDISIVDLSSSTVAAGSSAVEDLTYMLPPWNENN